EAQRPSEDGEDLRPDARQPRAAADGFPDQLRIRGASVARLALLPVPGFRRERLGDRFPYDRNHGTAEGSLLQPSPDDAAHPDGPRGIRCPDHPGPFPSRRRLYADDADVPCARLGRPLHGHAFGTQDRVRGALYAGNVREADQNREGDLHPLRADHPANAAERAGNRECGSFRADDDRRRLRPPAGAGAGSAGPRDRRLHILWAIGSPARCSPPRTSSRNISAKISRRNSAIGRRSAIAAPLVDLRVVDENMADVPHDGESVGEIVVRAPWLTTGYLNNPEASEVLWGGGYMHTGDVASIDPDGYLRIADRLKDIVKSGGEWISSIQLENIIMEKPGVRRAAVIPITDVKWGERPLALVILEPDQVGKVGEDDIRLHVASYVERGIISKIAIPENVTFVAELPLTSVGKIDKKKLRVAYA